MKNSLLLLIGALLIVRPVEAEPLPLSHTEYAAVKILETPDGQFTQRVFHSFGNERIEMKMQGMDSVLISRPDKQLAWQLLPAMNMYIEIALDTARKMTSKIPDDLDIQKLTNEIIDGVHATKYKLVMRDKSAGGFIWLSPENIPLKIDLITKQDGRKQRVSMQLKDLQIAAQAIELFELPADYSALPKRADLMQSMGISR